MSKYRPDCSICGQPFRAGEQVLITCLGFNADGETILNFNHEPCMDRAVADLVAELDQQGGSDD